MLIGINACQDQSFEIDRHQWVAMPMDIEVSKEQCLLVSK